MAVTMVGTSVLGLGTAPANPHPRTLGGHGGTLSSLGPRAWTGAAGLGAKWVQSGGGPSSTEREAADRWLDGATWCPSRRLQGPGTFLFLICGFPVRDFFPSSRQGSVTIRTHCPLIGFCLDMATYQRAQPRHFKQDRTINPPTVPREPPTVPREPPARQPPGHRPPQGVPLPPVPGVPPPSGENQKSPANDGQIKAKVKTIG